MFSGPRHLRSRLAVASFLCALPATRLDAQEEEDTFQTRERRAIRGCAIDKRCRQSAREVLREFEWEELRVGRDSPWIDPGGEKATLERDPERLPDWLRGIEMPDLPVRFSDQVLKYLTFYKDDPRGHAIMAQWLREQGRYRDLIVADLKRAGLPEDLLYVAMVESSYVPTTLSYAGASGLWQFMSAGGSIYGLRQDFWIDERNDPVRATRAVMPYWRDLYERFGDWHLALTAFNAGFGAVLASIARYNTNDYWRLISFENGLPWESSLYVPKILAAAIVGRNRARFGFAEVKPAARAPAFDEVPVAGTVPMATLARAAGVELELLRDLNPHLKRDRTPPGDSEYPVRVPRGRANEFRARLKGLRDELPPLDVIAVRQGETLSTIAEKRGLSASKVRKLNGAQSDAEAGPGTLLLLPKQTKKEIAASKKDKEKLIVAVAKADREVRGRQRLYYRVVAGDTLSGIAHAFKVGSAEIVEWNKLDGKAHIQPKMVLEIWAAKNFRAKSAGVTVLDEDEIDVVESGTESHLDKVEERRGRVRREYKAKKRESFADIGKRFGLSAGDLARINKKPTNTVLEPGDKIIVYETVKED